MTHPEWLEEIRERESKATPGPWEWEESDNTRWGMTARNLTDRKNHDVIHADDNYLDGREVDMEFVRHSRADIPKLLAYVDELEKKLGIAEERMRKVMSMVCPNENALLAQIRGKE